MLISQAVTSKRCKKLIFHLN